MNLLTPKQVAELLNCQPSTVYAWAGSGKIPAFKLNGCLRFDSKEVEEWVERNRLKSVDIGKEAKRILASTHDVDVDAVVRKSIDSVRGKVYNSPKGKPDPNQALKKGGSCGAV